MACDGVGQAARSPSRYPKGAPSRRAGAIVARGGGWSNRWVAAPLTGLFRLTVSKAQCILRLRVASRAPCVHRPPQIIAAPRE